MSPVSVEASLVIGVPVISMHRALRANENFVLRLTTIDRPWINRRWTIERAR